MTLNKSKFLKNLSSGIYFKENTPDDSHAIVKENSTGQVIGKMSMVPLMGPQHESMFVTYNRIFELD